MKLSAELFDKLRGVPHSVQHDIGQNLVEPFLRKKSISDRRIKSLSDDLLHPKPLLSIQTMIQIKLDAHPLSTNHSLYINITDITIHFSLLFFVEYNSKELAVQALPIMSQEKHKPAFADQRTVYIIDTDPSTEPRIRQLTRQLDVDLRSFTSAQAFLRSVSSQVIHNSCLITEMELPDMHGLDLLQLLQKNQPSLPIIFLTRQSNIQTAVRAMQAHAIDYMEKPFIERDLFNQIRKALSL